MAFDTVIDKAQLEAAMKASADAIREKTGDTADCTWDPAQGFAALIAAIEAGGGITPPYGLEVIVEEIVPAEDITSDYDIPCLIPDTANLRFLIFENETKPDNSIPNSVIMGYSESQHNKDGSQVFRKAVCYRNQNGLGNTLSGSYSAIGSYYTGTDKSSIRLYGDPSRKFSAGVRYCIMVFIGRLEV